MSYIDKSLGTGGNRDCARPFPLALQSLRLATVGAGNCVRGGDLSWGRRGTTGNPMTWLVAVVALGCFWA